MYRRAPSMALLAGTSLLKAQEKTTDGGLAEIEDKKKPEREKLITPPGSISARNMAEHCTSCQLCINICPNDVLRPSNSLDRFMQPEVSYERAYYRRREDSHTGGTCSMDKGELSACRRWYPLWQLCPSLSRSGHSDGSLAVRRSPRWWPLVGCR